MSNRLLDQNMSCVSCCRHEREKQDAYVNEGWTVWPLQGNLPRVGVVPGRRFALPWAARFKPVGLSVLSRDCWGHHLFLGG